MALQVRPVDALKKTEYLKLSEVARLTGVSRFVLDDIARFNILPAYVPAGKRAKYYRLPEVRRILAALAPLREKEIPLKHCRAELMRSKWYAELFTDEKQNNG